MEGIAKVRLTPAGERGGHFHTELHGTWRFSGYHGTKFLQEFISGISLLLQLAGSYGPYSSFRLKMRLWGQNNKNLCNSCVTTDMIVVIER